MFTGICKVTLRAEWVNTLKEKRMVVKSLISRMKNKFNISVAEVDCQDIHETIVIGFSCVSGESNHAEKIVQNVLDFIEWNTDAVVCNTEWEIY